MLVRGCQVVSYIWHKRVVFDLSCCHLIQSGLEDTEKTHLKDTENKAHSLLFK